MCGRYNLVAPGEEVARRFQLAVVPELAPRYNVAPTQPAPVVRRTRDGAGRELATLRWGLVPFWADDPSIGSRLINARAESAATKPAFRDSFVARRCLVPATGFFEWTKRGRDRQPWNLRMKGGRLFAMAGLWARWKNGETVLESFTILTGEPNAVAAPIHDRMPVILPDSAWEAWLDPRTPTEVARTLLVPYPDAEMEAYRVSAVVNVATQDVPACIEPEATLL